MSQERDDFVPRNVSGSRHARSATPRTWAGQGCAANTCDAEARDLGSSRAEKRLCPAASPERDECHAEDLALQQAHTAYS